MKMKKIVALVTASALCLGMSMTVFAENSLTDQDVADVNPSEEYDNPGSIYPTDDKAPYIEAGSLTDDQGKLNTINEIYSRKYDEFVKAHVGEGKDYDTEAEIPASKIEALKEEAKKEYKTVVDTFADSDKLKAEVENGLKDLGYTLKDGSAPTVVCAANLTLKKPVIDRYGNVTGYEDITDSNDPALKAGIKQTFYIGEVGAYGKLEADDEIVVLHYKADGTWEVIPATVTVLGDSIYAEVTFTSLSPVAFVRMSNGDLVEVDPETGAPVEDENGNNNVIGRPDTNANANANANTNANTNANANTNVKKVTTVSTGRSPKTGEF